GPQGAAGSGGPARGGERVRSARRCRGGAAGGDLGRGAAGGARRRAQRLFRPGRPLAPRDSSGVAAARGVRPGDSAARPVRGDNRFPLSFAQQRLWFLDQLEPDSPAYNVPLPVRLRGELPAARLARIAAELVGRHETLRTTFLESDGEPVQVVHAVPEPAPAL